MKLLSSLDSSPLRSMLCLGACCRIIMPLSCPVGLPGGPSAPALGAKPMSRLWRVLSSYSESSSSATMRLSSLTSSELFSEFSSSSSSSSSLLLLLLLRSASESVCS